jgi:hypothetical protein
MIIITPSAIEEEKFETLLETLYTYEGWESRMFN